MYDVILDLERKLPLNGVNDFNKECMVVHDLGNELLNITHKNA